MSAGVLCRLGQRTRAKANVTESCRLPVNETETETARGSPSGLALSVQGTAVSAVSSRSGTRTFAMSTTSRSGAARTEVSRSIARVQSVGW